MKEQIFALRELGYTYDQIKATLGCSKGTISYHLGKGVKEKQVARLRRNRLESRLDINKNYSYKSYAFRHRVRDYRDRSERGSITVKELKEVILHQEYRCYLTGEQLTVDNYSLDHIVPSSKGGTNNKENLGVVTRKVNYMKRDLSVEEFVNYCELVLRNFNYKVKRPSILKSKVLHNEGECGLIDLQ